MAPAHEVLPGSCHHRAREAVMPDQKKGGDKKGGSAKKGGSKKGGSKKGGSKKGK